MYLAKGGSIGGAQRQLLYLLTTLGKSFEPVVVCTSQGEIVDRLGAAGIRVEILPLHPWRKLPSGVQRYIDAERLAALARRYDPGLIHASDMWLGNYLAWVQWRLKIPSVVHVRGPVGGRDIRKHRLRRANGLISISKKITRALMVGRIPADNVVQIEDAVDIDLFRPHGPRPSVLAASGAGTSVVNIGLAGRVEPAKRQLDFVKAACKVLADMPGQVRFFVIGEVRDPDYLKRLKRLADGHDLDGQLVFTGRRDDMPDVLNSLDVLVSLSGGSVMYEAMSCGTCVVSAGYTRPEDSMHLNDGVTGRVTPSRAPSALASVLKHLVRHPEVRHQLGSAARERAQERFSCSTMVERTAQLYDRLIVTAP